MKQQQRRAKDIDDALRVIRACLERIAYSAPAALSRDAGPSVGPDGFPGGGDSEVRASGVTSSTERAALARREVDVVRVSIRAATTGLAEVIRSIALVAENYEYAASVGEENQGRQSQAPTCVNCGELALWPDRKTAKAGRCPRCYQHRQRHGMDRLIARKVA